MPKSPAAPRWLACALALLLLSLGRPALAQGLGDFISPGELAEAHHDLSGITQCVACHELGAGVSAPRCLECHEHTNEQVTSGQGFHSDKSTNCESCHPDHRGFDFQMVTLMQETFNHTQTGFPLRGAHKDTDCAECHTEPDIWVGLDTECLACHAEDDPHQHEQARPLASRCGDCHTEVDWDALPLATSVFDHDDPQQADYALHGEHESVACEDCHEEWEFVPIESEACEDCHDDLHGGQFAPRTCDDCHTVEVPDFALRTFDHSTTDYPLDRAHQPVACEGCHGDGEDAVYVDLPHSSCETCHDDPHSAQFAPKACEDCHSTSWPTFELPKFDHDQTDYPLTGAHEGVSCGDCHTGGADAVYVDLPHERCDTCHEDVHEGQFAPRDCVDCHSLEQPDFSGLGFDHDQTDYPLRGEHEDVACEDCHGEGPTAEFAGLPAEDCSSCHEDFHEGAFDPDACSSCHIDGQWTLDDFDHDRTAYPLDGAHEAVACEDCHGSGEERQLTGLAFETCFDCHADQEPHTGVFAAAECSSCHVVEDWLLSIFDHDTVESFPLQGRHEPLGCEECHAEDLTFHLDSAECESCHEPDRPRDHFDQQACGPCHLSTGWTPATLGGQDHASTGFALHGAHSTVSCGECHDDDPVSPFCVDCHATDDPHRNMVGDTCDSCHTVDDWLLTRFYHATTGYRLVGSHRLAACDDCHATGYAGTPTACRRCHENETPNDRLHNDPLTRECDSCHRPFDWDQVRFPH